jgi:hypothetical protein
VKEYELTVVYRANDDQDAEEVRGMIAAVLHQLDHPVALSGPARLSPRLDPHDE